MSGTTRGSAADARPVDIEKMQETAQLLLHPDAGPDAFPPAAEVDTLTLAMRGHLEVLIPAVEGTVGKRPKSVAETCALACVGEARGKLRARPKPGLDGAVSYAQRLARVLDALCDHYERLSGGGLPPEQAALRRLGQHSAKCKTCTAVDGDGANLGLDCEVGERLYDEYRQACRNAASSMT
ncbi:DUF6415 family natural product biosynthesis protein [Streptomyces chartreusis]|uniref:DUF6415 family natural product biosynthesis protein n=1 Tax=Streptomyces chartreusis TaxID=1969 RepID=UPI0036340760